MQQIKPDLHCVPWEGSPSQPADRIPDEVAHIDVDRSIFQVGNGPVKSLGVLLLHLQQHTPGAVYQALVLIQVGSKHTNLALQHSTAASVEVPLTGCRQSPHGTLVKLGLQMPRWLQPGHLTSSGTKMQQERVPQILSLAKATAWSMKAAGSAPVPGRATSCSTPHQFSVVRSTCTSGSRLGCSMAILWQETPASESQQPNSLAAASIEEQPKCYTNASRLWWRADPQQSRQLGGHTSIHEPRSRGILACVCQPLESGLHKLSPPCRGTGLPAAARALP